MEDMEKKTGPILALDVNVPLETLRDTVGELDKVCYHGLVDVDINNLAEDDFKHITLEDYTEIVKKGDVDKHILICNQKASVFIQCDLFREHSIISMTYQYKQGQFLDVLFAFENVGFCDF